MFLAPVVCTRVRSLIMTQIAEFESTAGSIEPADDSIYTPDICTICADSCECGSHTLACGHTFHVACILHWFRMEQTTCPNCRSEREDRFWVRKTPGERIGMLRRKRKSLPKLVQKKLEKLDAHRTQRIHLRKEQAALRRQYASVFTKYNRLTQRIRYSTLEHRRLRDDLAYNQASIHVPFLQSFDNPEESEEEEDDFGSSEEEEDEWYAE